MIVFRLIVCYKDCSLTNEVIILQSNAKEIVCKYSCLEIRPANQIPADNVCAVSGFGRGG